jgi:uncharacterized protein YraI
MSRPLSPARRAYGWMACLFLGTLLAACASGPAAASATASSAAGEGTLAVIGTQAAERETLTATALWPTDTPTPTQTATATVTPSATPTATASPTPLPSGTVTGTTTLRAGPGRVYPVVAHLEGGETARPLGRTEAGDWLLVRLETDEEGWLPAEAFVQVEGGEAPVITDLPPTPTLPPATLTPTVPPPTATHTRSPFACDLSIQRDPNGRNVILVGQGWPPQLVVDLTVTLIVNGAPRPQSVVGGFSTGDADDQIPNGFWHQTSIPFVSVGDGVFVRYSGPATYTASTSACSKSATIDV